MLFTNPLFIQHVIHDIQGDFLGVSGICQSMKRGLEENKDIAGLLNILIENCRTYKYKLGNFLEFTRMQAGLTRTVRAPANIRRLLNQVIDEYEPLWIERNARIGLDIAPRLPDEFSCDEGKIQLIVSNLFFNAVYFSPPGSTITIAAGFAPPPSPATHHQSPTVADPSPTPQQWTITITDNGEGMTPTQMDALFASEPSTRAVLRNGAGLGLIVSRWLTETVLGGKMQLKSQPGAGTHVWIDLPFYPYE